MEAPQVPQIEVPQGFARATGVKEGRRVCGHCQRTFPVVNNDQKCPYCGCTQTSPLPAGD